MPTSGDELKHEAYNSCINKPPENYKVCDKEKTEYIELLKRKTSSYSLHN